MNNIGFTADLHLGHYNIVLHCHRIPWMFPNPSYNSDKPFHFKLNNPWAVNIQKHDADIISNINSVLDKKDTLYILGDFAYKNHARYINMINPKIVFIKGNHDKASREVYKLFKEMHDFGCDKEMTTGEVDSNGKYKRINITLCHYAMRSWNKSCYDSVCLYGHSHGRMPEFDNWLSFDVGVDVWGYSPLLFDVMLQKVKLIKGKASQHGDGEDKPIGTFNESPDQRMIDTRLKNRKIVESMGIPTQNEMWPTALTPPA